jgi:hypothetical protein
MIVAYAANHRKEIKMRLEKLQSTSSFLSSNKVDWFICAALLAVAAIGLYSGAIGEKAAVFAVGCAVVNGLCAYFNLSAQLQKWITSKLTGKRK